MINIATYILSPIQGVLAYGVYMNRSSLLII